MCTPLSTNLDIVLCVYQLSKSFKPNLSFWVVSKCTCFFFRKFRKPTLNVSIVTHI